VLSFGQVPSGQSAQKTLTLTNASTTLPLTIRRITSAWPFLATSTCGTTLAPGTGCVVTLSYTPLNQIATGTTLPPPTGDIGSLIIESDAASSPDLIDLTGSSTAATLASPSNVAPIASFVPSQSSLTFASTMAGNVSAPQIVTLDNTGTATLQITGIQTTPDYTVVSNCAAILPGASCTLSITFTPQSTAPLGVASSVRASAIEISSNASTPLEFISVVGVSTPSTLALSQTALNFGTVVVGTTSALGVQVTNTGLLAVTFSGVTAIGNYTATDGTCPSPGLTLAPGTSCTVQAIFAPTQAGTLTGTLSIATSASTLPLTVALTGMGVQSQMLISPASLSFGAIAVGSPATLSLTLANTGTASITNISSTITAPTTGEYAVTVPCAVTTLAPGMSCSLTVTFTPAALGARPGTLTIASSDSSSPDMVPLTGSGVVNGTFTLSVDGSASGSATVKSGSPADYGLILTPINGFSGTVVLNCSAIVPADYTYCSLAPSSVTLNGSAQNAVATLNTVTSIASNTNRIPATQGRSFRDTVLALLLPMLIFSWKARTSRHRAWRRFGPMAWAFLATAALLSASGCTRNNADPNLRYSTPGVYQYQVTATSVSGAVQTTQTVTLNLTID
jgi:trimeric autotransporter adhesin